MMAQYQADLRKVIVTFSSPPFWCVMQPCTASGMIDKIHLNPSVASISVLEQIRTRTAVRWRSMQKICVFGPLAYSGPGSM